MNSDPGPVTDPYIASRRQRPFLLVCAVVSLLSAGLLVYSQTAAFAWDEGFHLLAAQLIKNGKRPYLDFFFPQTALNAYWNALWMQVFGESWRTSHAIAAILTSASALLMADFIFVRFPVQRWRLAASLVAAILMVTNVVVFEFGPLGQAYGLCLFLIVAAFRASLGAVDRKSPYLAAAAGFLASAAAGSSLLTAPAAPVLLLWILLQNRAGKRWAKFVAFAAGAGLALLPLIRLFLISPRQVKFNIVDYHLFYRQVEWSGAITHDLFEVMLAWTTCSQALVLGLLAASGLLFARFRSGWDRRLLAELYLCGWLALALGVHVSTAHPTFPRYYLLTVPFLSVLAAAGLYSIAERIYEPDRPFWPALLITLLVSLGLARSLYDGHDDRKWKDVEKLAAKVEQVTSRQAVLLADEHIYFLTKRPPPSGTESEDSHKLQLSPAEAERLRIVPRPELERRIKAGLFSTVETCAEDDDVAKLGLPGVYTKKEKMDDCYVFWDPKR